MKKMTKFMLLVAELLLAGCSLCLINCRGEQAKKEQLVGLYIDPHKIKHVFCDVCGKDMTDENGVALIGYEFRMEGKHEWLWSEFVQRQMGPYKKRQYYICWECVLRHMGVKP